MRTLSRMPLADLKLADAIRTIRAASITRLEQLQDSYADEAEVAARRKEHLGASRELAAESRALSGHRRDAP